MSEGMPYEWVIAGYPPSSDRGKSVLAHLNQGLGYYLLNPSRGKMDQVIVGFKRAYNSPLEPYLQVATPAQADKLEELERRRHGIAKSKRPSPADMFPTH